MTIRFKFIFLLFCGSISGIAQNDISLSNQQLLSSGIKRLSGIYILMDDWNAITFDGYRWYASANALSSFNNQNWILMLDGQQIDINFFNLNHINILPLTINYIDSIQTVTHPRISSGTFTTSGLINLRTLRPSKGLSVAGRYSAGNETGDPGPYYFTEQGSPNVEEDGPNLSASVEYGSENIWGRLFFYTESFSATDTAIRKRNPQLNWQDFKGRRFSPSLQLGFNAFNGTHNLFLGYSTSEIQPFHPRSYTSNDLIYINPAARDYPVQMSLEHAGLNGHFNLTSSSQIKYSIKASANKLYGAQAEPDNFDHRQKFYYSNFQYSNSDVIRFFLGAGYEYTVLSASYSSINKGINIFKTYGGLEFKLIRNFLSQLGAEVLFSNSKTGLKAYVNNQWQHTAKLRTDLNIAAIQTLPEERKDLWYWIENGYDVLKRLDIIYSFEGKRKKELKFTIDFNFNYEFTRAFNINTGLLYRNFKDYFSENVTVTYNPVSSLFNTFTLADINSSGSVAGFSIRLNHELYQTLKQSFHYRFLNILSGDFSFKDEWSTIPKHKLSYTITFIPYNNFSLWAKLTAISSVKWNYFPNLKETSEGFYNAKFDERFILDFSIRKTFWKDRLRLNLLFKNILNNELQYHPLGAKFNLTVYFSAEFVFSSITD